jgi:hypothetical protein
LLVEGKREKMKVREGERGERELKDERREVKRRKK